MPQKTGKMSYTETAGGMTASLTYVLEPQPPVLEESVIFLNVPAWAKDAIRASVPGGTVTVTYAGDPPAISTITVK
jgi:hypothetical protein